MWKSMSTTTTPPQTDAELIAEALAFTYGITDQLEPSDAPPPSRPERRRAAKAKAKGWYPNLNPTQDDIFNDPADNVLGHGEKGSGKTIGFAHKIVRHCYENDNALALIIAPSMRTGNEGIWHDLDTLVLPAWRDGNRDESGKLIDEGIGLEYTASKLDPNTKDRHRWIRNKHGGWSKLLLMSIMYASQVESRVKGPAPSLVYIDEVTNCEGVEYYTYTSAQLGRRRGIVGPQQFLASCNPKGPSHWVYKLFFEQMKGDPAYSVYHVPIAENLKWLPPGYYDRLAKTFKSDPVETARLMRGEWIDRPTGDGLFKEYYNEGVHLKGSLVKGLGLKPLPGFPILVGYDLGQVYSSVTFLQAIPTKDGKVLWIVFDEVDSLNQKILYKSLAWQVIERMRYWRKLIGYEFHYEHIADNTAVNQWRPGHGSYDARDFEVEFNKVSKEFGGRKMKIRGCPKGAGSVAARVRTLQGKLYQEELFVSATCPNAHEMMLYLEADKDNPENPKRSKFLHKFDSMTYPMLATEMGGGVRKYLPTGQVAPSLIRCG